MLFKTKVTSLMTSQAPCVMCVCWTDNKTNVYIQFFSSNHKIVIELKKYNLWGLLIRINKLIAYNYNFWILYFIIPNHNKNKLHLFLSIWRKNGQLKLKPSFGLFPFNQCFFLVSFELGFQWIGFDNFLLVNWKKNRLLWAGGTCVLGAFLCTQPFVTIAIKID